MNIGKHYFEFHGSIRIHFYCAFYINMFPILAVVRYDDPHSKNNWSTYSISLLGVTFTKKYDCICCKVNHPYLKERA